METAEYLTALRRDGDAFAESAVAAGLAAAVPSCPGWTVADLVWHLTEVHYFWASVVVQQATRWDEVGRIVRVDEDDLLPTYHDGLARLCQDLANTDPATEVWTWADQHDVAFVIRRMAHETAVHRWDMDRAAGLATSVEPMLASDGIDEFLTHFVDDVSDDAEPVGGSVHIHCGDVAGEWTIRPNESGTGFDVTREHAKGDAALRGHASALLLALWRRVGTDTIDVVGDADVARRFLAAPNLS